MWVTPQYPSHFGCRGDFERAYTCLPVASPAKKVLVIAEEMLLDPHLGRLALALVVSRVPEGGMSVRSKQVSEQDGSHA